MTNLQTDDVLGFAKMLQAAAVKYKDKIDSTTVCRDPTAVSREGGMRAIFQNW